MSQLKGISVVGTGDFTHPGWFSEIKEKLVPIGDGLFKLKEDLSKRCDEQVPRACRGTVYFILSCEISNIYKKRGKTRKNHNLVCLPDIALVEQFNSKLNRIGNIKSDGRPILGLDVRNLLEILLDTSDDGYLIPAHIWTPWFSLLGSKSGFNSLDECFEDLTPHVFAVETGLSSDPAMNWRVSGLDHLTLVSNSDAHSPDKLGREANLFDTDISYQAIRSALKEGNPKQFLGTIEFYPEEGKYHLDGHRKCKVRFWPKKTKKNNGICPVCGKEVTKGVLYRIEELADRPEGIKPEKTSPFYPVIPLKEILSEILKVGSGSKKVKLSYNKLLSKLGTEFDILQKLSLKNIDSAGIPLLGEAVKRMRKKEVKILPGYDGEFGKIKFFETSERLQLLGQKTLFSIPTSDLSTAVSFKNHLLKGTDPVETTAENHFLYSQFDSNFKRLRQSYFSAKETILNDLNPEQQKAIQYNKGPLLIIAGPGTGKTRTLTRKVAYLIHDKRVLPEEILAVTFTNKAAQEMNDRLRLLLTEATAMPLVTTFHSLCYTILKDQNKNKDVSSGGAIIDDHDRKTIVLDAIKLIENKGDDIFTDPLLFLDKIILAKQQILDPNDDLQMLVDQSEIETFQRVYKTYQHLLSIQKLFDYEELIFRVVRLFETDKETRKTYQNRFKSIFVDEYQDINYAQYRLIKMLSTPVESESDKNICVIGDPDQAIYGFRGSDVRFFELFVTDHPEAKTIHLTRNYRSTETILKASHQIIKGHRHSTSKARVFSDLDGVKTIGILENTSGASEAEAISIVIEKQIGGTGYHSLDFGWIENGDGQKGRSFSDFAVLYRTNDQGRVLADVFNKSGIPHQIVNKDRTYYMKYIPEIISLLKIIEGVGSYLDLERAMAGLGTGVRKKAITSFKNWAYSKGFGLKEALQKARWHPIHGMSRNQQIKFHDISKNIFALAGAIESISVSQKLLYLSENSPILDKINTNPDSAEFFNRIVGFSEASGMDTLDFLSSLALEKDTDLYDSQVEKVSLMTLHAAKGLEFSVVFISGCETGYIPYERAGHQKADLSEERRLFYVAMTRAKEELYFSWAKKRRIFGRYIQREQSLFINQIEDKLKQNRTQPKKRKDKEPIQLNLF
ncbi:MAG: UvrD-helicase domain-containing protein [Desulfobacterales bacterium]|nr:UvrD-helicase domain-containing protein [Desulfobacterales bacterium]MDP6807266.1 UvrD-helicase domain-containing protein [Desulfobacterales bacterium]